MFSAVGERPISDDRKFSAVAELSVIVDLVFSAAASAKVTAAPPLINVESQRFLATSAVFLTRPEPATPWQRSPAVLSLCAVVPAPDPAAVAAPPRAVVDAALKKVNWGAVYPRVLAFAISRTKSKARAEDATQDAIRAVYDHELRAWNPEVAPDIVPVLFGIVRRDLGHERGSARVHHEITVLSKAHDVRVTRAVSQVASSAPSAETALATRELLSRRIARVRERAAADPLVLSLLDSVERGVDTAAEQVTTLGVPLEDIRRARRRFFDHVAAVARELPEENCDDEGDE